ncbi:S8 family peptidase [uncultured Thiodictyon sp.]|uniref:S8 family peptidase n=1 Tax=uncultured Thiodictyon sp. TaxID=1846217 RepID=UPI0025DB57D5|nr:S8 family peptidase [uncultured Thiodictyon sp.]
MSEYPLLIFPTREVMKRPDGHGGGGMPHKPGLVRQVAHLGPKFEALRDAFESERLAFQTNPQGLAPDFVLVIETFGRIEDFRRAAQAIGMHWLGEIDQEDLDPNDDFWIPNAKTGARTDKPLDGRIYLGMANQQAMTQLLRLWNLYQAETDLGRGNQKWRDLFAYAKDIRRWGARDRLRPEIIEDWREEDDTTSVPFRLELWFDQDGQTREAAVRRAISEVDGEVLAAVRIDDIRFHALKGRLPRAAAQAAVAFADGGEESTLATIFRHNEVRYFLPEAQGVAIMAPDSEAGPAVQLPPPTEQDPVVALLDGHPLAGHQLLDGRLRINDPDDTLASYQPGEMRHGTAMASLILHGELDFNAPPLTRPLYCRPVLVPDPGCPDREHIPETAFAEDRIHRAVVEMFEGAEPAAPTVRFVNLSVGEEAFHDEMSPWGRLIDWLAFKYRLLFCISVGNQTEAIETHMTDADFQALPEATRIDATIRHLGQTLGERTLLSPGEAINALTVGALHCDQSNVHYLANRVDLLPSNTMPSPVIRLGPGYRNAIKPDILLAGGRQLYSYWGGNGHYKIASAGLPPGQKVAIPDTQGAGDLTKTAFTRGTSNATALASRAAARLCDILESLRVLPGGERIDRDTTAPLLKALLVHGASWPENAEAIGRVIPVPNHRRKRAIARFIGYGVADTARVETCAAQRATVLGCGLLNQDQAHEYAFPLPMELSDSAEWRRLTITLAWLSPVSHQHRAYRQAKLSFDPPANELSLKRQQADWQQVRNGTVQHEILDGDQARVFIDGEFLRIKISAQGDTQQDFDDEVPYGLAVTLEVAESCGLPIYQRVREKLGVAIQATA